MITVAVSPALNPDGRRAYSGRGPLFVAMVDGRRVIERSPQPLCDSCRALLLDGVDPKTPVVMRHGNSPHDALRSTVGVAAGLTVLDTAGGKPVFRPHRMALPAIAGSPPIAPMDQPALSKGGCPMTSPGSLMDRRRAAVERIEELAALQESYVHPARTREIQQLNDLVDSIDRYLGNAA